MNATFKCYLVGGAVRDLLLNRPVEDRDWVVVGATPEQMRAAGFMPVGKDFPVFLHPKTHEEYALARTERKVASGYHGFSFYTDPSVTLEQDLYRRDLTINAMAQSESGELIDPLGGLKDLKNKILRHASPAFIEDPVRVLRLARFAARFVDFTVAPETISLAQSMVSSGELSALVAERVWQETQRALCEPEPVRFFEVLEQAQALDVIFPDLAAHWQTHQNKLKQEWAEQSGDTADECLMRRFILLCWNMDESIFTRFANRVRVPSDLVEAVRKVAQLMRFVEPYAGQPECMDVADIVHVLELSDCARRPVFLQRFAWLVGVVWSHHKSHHEIAAWIQSSFKQYTQAFLAVNASQVLANVPANQKKQALHEARINAVAAAVTAQ
jgi:tRNA nucleotidyltransferase (CCA-adding enzyme)